LPRPALDAAHDVQPGIYLLDDFPEGGQLLFQGSELVAEQALDIVLAPSLYMDVLFRLSRQDIAQVVVAPAEYCGHCHQGRLVLPPPGCPM
jgi:hypothetical protein